MHGVSSAVARRVRDLLKKHNMTQYRLEQITGIQHGSMQALMGGKTDNVTLYTVMRIARGFNMSLSDFLDEYYFTQIRIPFYGDKEPYEYLFSVLTSSSEARHVYFANLDNKNEEEAQALRNAYEKALKRIKKIEDRFAGEGWIID